MDKKAEWWINECGGVLCSNCGAFHDDYYGEPAPDSCPRCNSKMTVNNEMYVHKEGRLSLIHSSYYIDENEYPDWLLNSRKKYTT